MRSMLAAALAPLCLTAQDPAPASSAVQEWQKQNATSLVAYEAERTKERAKVAKSVVDLERREDSWLSLARDVFGLTNNNMMDPATLTGAAVRAATTWPRTTQPQPNSLSPGNPATRPPRWMQ